MVISSPETRHYWIIWDTICLINDVIVRKFSKMDGTGDNYQCLVPKQLRKNVIFQAHDCILSGHFGSKMTVQKLLQKYYWYNLKEEVNNYIMRCDICEANKFSQKKPKVPLGSLLTGAPLDCLATDIFWQLPTTSRNNKSTVHASTGKTPNLLMLGREVRIPAELAYGSTTKYIPQDITSYGEYVDYLKEHMQIAHDVARKHLSSEARRHKEIYDTKNISVQV
ncbi:unnamed protein product [Mytilus coruscus]|uniref:Integrase zinc-binding domain-containing protein n=1 Tax=Mytilus coruscus TaxID=42192 RepID=A0A6J8F461_MYTCO|nr:unnamed protein product [Mytilus coruscus]